jgi:branched-chain amino acid aminotransferase
MRPARSRVVWFNGTLVPESEARLSIYDSALMFGDMVFEMTRSFNGKQFKLREHLERLFASIKILRIPLQLSISEVERAVYETIDANAAAFEADDEHRVLIDVSRGLLSLYAGNVEGIAPGPTVIVADFPLRWTVAGMAPLFDIGINAVVPSQRAIPASLLDPKIKSRSRQHYMMANIEVSTNRIEHSWAVLLDTDGFLAEGTGDNIFVVRDDQLLTPEGRNVLRGISREYVMQELAPQIGLHAEERNLELYDLATADEAFVTATPFCILPVTRLNGEAIGTARPGPITRRLLQAWSANVGVDIAEQIRAWDSRARTTSGASPYAFRPSR